VATDVEMNGVHPTDLAGPLGLGSRHDLGRFDPVLRTADDPPRVVTLPALVDPAADHFDPEVAGRRADVEAKHRRVVAFLDAHDYDAVLLTRSDSIAWITSGGDLNRHLAAETAAVAVFVNRTTRAVLADNVQSARVFEEEVAGLGFQLKERPWYQDSSRIIAELTHNRQTATDAYHPGLDFEPDKLRSLRTPLSLLERRNLRSLGATLALAVEATCRGFRPGETEAELAGQLAHRLIREGVTPIDLRVAGEDRLARYRQPTFKAARIRRRATITAVGRRRGLCASVTRVVSFGPVDAAFGASHTLASMVDATCIYFSRPGEPISEILRRARRIYAKFDHPHEWVLDYQGSVIGYAPREMPLLPDNPAPLEAGSALNWSPSVGAARSEDTIIIDDDGFEVVTEAREWPMIEVSVKGFTIKRPGILER